MFREIASQAWQGIKGSLLRALFTIIIIALGIMALVGVLTAIEGIRAYFLESFGGLGANTIYVQNVQSEIRVGNSRGGRPKRLPPITLDEGRAFAERMKDVAQVSLQLDGTGTGKARYLGNTTNPNLYVLGADENYLPTVGYDIAEGRALNELDGKGAPNICIIGNEIKLKLFGNAPAVGKNIVLGKKQYRVIGVFKEQGSTFGTGADRTVVLPLLTLLKDYPDQSGRRSLDVAMYVKEAPQMEVVKGIATGVMRSVRALKPHEEDNFYFVQAETLVNTLLSLLSVLTVSAVGIAIVTMISSGISLMNIMLVSVTERIREIGVRKALGASKGKVRLQFLLEAIFICFIGGAAGVVLGMLVGNVFSFLLGSSIVLPIVPMIWAIILCTLIGVGAGFYPANRAANLDPIESLRFE